MNRIYHNHTKWENLEMYYNSNFDIDIALEFINDTKEFSKSMFRVTCEYKYACEHHLTSNINKVAWLGQAACFKSTGCNESATRKAWGLLPVKKQKLSNTHAQKCIDTWLFFHKDQGVKSLSGPYIDTYLKKDYDFIPDELPSELIDLAPAYKFICSAILKNDQHLTTLGYSKPKSEYYSILKKIEINERTSSCQR